MQLIETTVHRNTVVDVVEFVGEGGEAISVSLAANGKEDAELIETAKQMMAQLIAFDRQDTGRAEESAELYTFEYQDRGVVRVMPGISLPDLHAVQQEVRQSAEDLWRDALDNAVAPVGWAVRARNSSGDIVATCSYDEVQLHDA
ncbi:DUF6894 family protein [Mesorhizobium carmichaelinearum]|uniref:DUF6894 family protein n=1 Tax=Mesorhizobium carmichaelinearum TaxID=1208188 RepID=UPI000BA4D526|nr:hypothetical protein [Mesorhizobium carmichaelinearum]